MLILRHVYHPDDRVKPGQLKRSRWAWQLPAFPSRRLLRFIIPDCIILYLLLQTHLVHRLLVLGESGVLLNIIKGLVPIEVLRKIPIRDPPSQTYKHLFAKILARCSSNIAFIFDFFNPVQVALFLQDQIRHNKPEV